MIHKTFKTIKIIMVLYEMYINEIDIAYISPGTITTARDLSVESDVLTATKSFDRRER